MVLVASYGKPVIAAYISRSAAGWRNGRGKPKGLCPAKRMRTTAKPLAVLDIIDFVITPVCACIAQCTAVRPG